MGGRQDEDVGRGVCAGELTLIQEAGHEDSLHPVPPDQFLQTSALGTVADHEQPCTAPLAYELERAQEKLRLLLRHELPGEEDHRRIVRYAEGLADARPLV